MSDKEQLFTDLTPEEGANISGGQGKNGPPVNLKLPNSHVPEQSTINLSPPPPKKPKLPEIDVDKDCKSVFPTGGNVGLFGTTDPIGGGVVIRF